MLPAQSRGDLCLALASARPDRCDAFRAALEGRGFRVEAFRDAWSLLQSARGQAWNLVVVDGQTLPARAVLDPLRAIHPDQPAAVVTDLPPQAFQQAMAGLDVLALLPACPTPADVEPLLASLRQAGGLDPRVEAAQANLDAMSRRHHPHCVVCWDRHPFGLKVDYRVTGAHQVVGHFDCGQSYQGYANVVHGGIVSSLLDGAMASCILAKGLEAYTVELKVRYRAAVETGVPATIRGEWLRGEGPIHLLHATLEQNGKVHASARAKFFEGTPQQPREPMPRGEGMRALLQEGRKRLR